ncbi:MAG: T9SS type A sorting domain-containing protein [Calditrichaeota bacterium]|nr:T9SS type A sorting domain-containing protein [Calditrichota bacterium]
MMKYIRTSLPGLFSLLLLFVLVVYGQETIFPGLTGQELIDSLRANYKPATVLSYDDARDVMFSEIDNYSDSVSGVYSGYTIYIDPAVDPSTDAYNKGMNTEHTWPQSKGTDSGNARSDLQHLFPCRAEVNSSRSNDPFADIPDADTDKWWRDDYYLTTIPTSYIDEYSEKDYAGWFEPREDHKGNAARAIFYIYTMYKEQLDTSFFYIQKETLRRWHYQDTVDAREAERNNRIAPYQDNKKNPFILDSTLVRRAYFEQSSDTTGGGNGNAQPGDIVITEIMQNPDAVYDTDGEWFEIYNASDHTIDLNGWIIKDLDTDSHTIASSVIIDPGQYLTLGRNADKATNGGVDIAYQYTGINLANGADEIILLLSDGATEIDRVVYDGGPNWPDPTGASMYFDGNFGQNNNDPSFWKVSDLPWDGSSGDFGTPGYANPVSDISFAKNKVVDDFALINFPNPFNPATTIVFTLPSSEQVKLDVFSLSGQKIVALLKGFQSPGAHSVKWNGRNQQNQKVPSGVYIVRLQAGNRFTARKIILMK